MNLRPLFVSVLVVLAVLLIGVVAILATYTGLLASDVLLPSLFVTLWCPLSLLLFFSLIRFTAIVPAGRLRPEPFALLIPIAVAAIFWLLLPDLGKRATIVTFVPIITTGTASTVQFPLDYWRAVVFDLVAFAGFIAALVFVRPLLVFLWGLAAAAIVFLAWWWVIEAINIVISFNTTALSLFVLFMIGLALSLAAGALAVVVGRRRAHVSTLPWYVTAKGLTMGERGRLSMFRGFIIPIANRERGLWVLGLPGSGKSRALEGWAIQDMLSARGVCFIDPHGDAFDHLLTRLAIASREYPDLASRVVVVNPLDPKWSVGFNPLASIVGMPPERVAGFMTDVVLKIWKTEIGDAPRMVRLLSFTFQALVEAHLTLLDLPRFLGDRAWRDETLATIKNAGVRAYFDNEFPQGDREAQQWIAPVLNRLGGLLSDPDMRVMFGQRVGLPWREILDSKSIILVNLNKGRLGETSSWVLGAFLIAQIQKAALSRADTPKRIPFYLYLDEFQNYTTGNIADILAESRKYGLSLILAHQSVTQLDTTLKNAVMNTTGTLASFLVSHADASTIAPDLLPQGSLVRDYGRLGILQLALKSDEITGLLTRLEKRRFWIRQRGDTSPIKLTALTMPDLPTTLETSEAKQKLVDASGSRYGTLKSDVTRDLEKQGVKVHVPNYGGITLTDDEE